MKIAFFSTKSYDKTYFNLFNKQNVLSYHEVSLNANTVELIKDEEAVCVFVNDHLDAETIALLALKNIKLIVLRCAGFNNVNLEACKKHNIKVVRVPAYSPNAVAEFAVALLLTLNRKTHKAYNRVREGNFNLENLEGFDLYQKTVGVIGTGKIGRIFIKIMQGFGCKVIAYDKAPATDLDVEYVPLKQLFEKSDVISLHCPLTPETQYLINNEALQLMKHGVFIINTGRGGLVHTKHVIEHLKIGKIGGLGLDVYEQESELFFTDHSAELIKDEVLLRLMTFPNVLITSHQGFFTKEALTQIATITLNNIDEITNTGKCKNEV
jgi:D-lactate dehydrogenase